MGGQRALAFSETSQGTQQIKAGIWSTSHLPMARQTDQRVPGQEIYLAARHSSGRSTRQSPDPHDSPSPEPLLQPSRLIATKSCFKIAQHHPGSEKQSHPLCGSPQSTQSQRPTIESRRWLFQPTCSIQVASEQAAGTPHSKGDSKFQWGAWETGPQIEGTLSYTKTPILRFTRHLSKTKL